MTEMDNNYLTMARRLQDAEDLGDKDFDSSVDDALMFTAMAAGEFIKDRRETESEYEVALEIALSGLERHLPAVARAAFTARALNRLGWPRLTESESSRHEQILADVLLSRIDGGRPTITEPSGDESHKTQQAEEDIIPAVEVAEDPEELYKLLREKSNEIKEGLADAADAAEDKILSLANKAYQHLESDEVFKEQFYQWLEKVKAGERPFSYLTTCVRAIVAEEDVELAQSMIDIVDDLMLEAMLDAVEEKRFRDAWVLIEQATGPHIAAQLEDLLDFNILATAQELLSGGISIAMREDVSDIYMVIDNFASRHNNQAIHSALDAYIVHMAWEMARKNKEEARAFIDDWISTDQLVGKIQEALNL